MEGQRNRTDRMHCSEASRRWTSAGGWKVKVLCFRSLCVWLCSILCLAEIPGPTEAAKTQRCGEELVADLTFVCGPRGVHLRTHSWSSYGPRQRGKGIVDRCCFAGCDLQYLEMYCAKPNNKGKQQTTATTLQPTTTAQQTVEEQFQTVFQKRLLEEMGPPDSEKRQNYKERKPQGPLKTKNKQRRKVKLQPTSIPPSQSDSPTEGITHSS